MSGITTPTWQPLADEEAQRLALAGRRPRLHAVPATPGELAAMLGAATREGLAVAPRGGGSKPALGNPPRRLDLVLELGRLSGVTEYRPDDLVAVALAGTPLAALQQTFAKHHQWLALDPPHATRATLGGVLATNGSGPHRLRYGTGRDLVLGMQAAYAGGTLARSGARVVKSVAGYDLHKLHVGALGTLGVIAEVAVRLHPLPAAQRVLACPTRDVAALGPLVSALLRLPLGLGALEALNDAAAGRLGLATGIPLPEGNLLLALCEGHPRVVGRQSDEVRRAAGANGLGVEEVAAGEAAMTLAGALAELPTPRSPGQMALKLTVPVGATCATLAELAATLAAEHADAEIQAHAGSGVLQAVLAAPLPAAPLVDRLRAAARTRQGHLVVQDCPDAARAGLDAWGPVGAPGLLRQLKAALDPAGTLNPGRYVEGV